MQALACEQVWFSITVLRDTQAEKLEGGIPQLTDAERRDISIVGVSLILHGDEKRVHIWAKFGILLGDEPPLKEILGCKGHAGVEMCCLCFYRVAHKHPSAYTMLHEVSTYAKSCVVVEFSVVKPHKDGASIRTLLVRLWAHRPLLSQTKFEHMESLYGWNYNPHNLILNERVRLDVVATLMFDWAHVLYLCSGLMDDEAGLCFKALHKERATTLYNELKQYDAAWTYPKIHEGAGAQFCDKKFNSNLKKSTFDGSASDMLTVRPVFSRYMERVGQPSGELPLHITSLLAVLHVVMLLHCVGRGIVDPRYVSSCNYRLYDSFCCCTWCRQGAAETPLCTTSAGHS